MLRCATSRHAMPCAAGHARCPETRQAPPALRPIAMLPVSSMEVLSTRCVCVCVRVCVCACVCCFLVCRCVEGTAAAKRHGAYAIARTFCAGRVHTTLVQNHDSLQRMCMRWSTRRLVFACAQKWFQDGIIKVDDTRCRSLRACARCRSLRACA